MVAGATEIYAVQQVVILDNGIKTYEWRAGELSKSIFSLAEAICRDGNNLTIGLQRRKGWPRT